MQLFRDATTGYGPEAIFLNAKSPGNFTHMVNAVSMPFQGEAVVMLFDKTGLRDTLFLSDIFTPDDESLRWWKTWTLDAAAGSFNRVNQVSEANQRSGDGTGCAKLADITCNTLVLALCQALVSAVSACAAVRLWRTIGRAAWKPIRGASQLYLQERRC